MTASVFKRTFSTIIDLFIVFAIIYVIFLSFGVTALQNRIDNFDTINENYQEIIEAYKTDLNKAREEYNVSIALANNNKNLENQALTDYNNQIDIINEQNLIDIQPFNEPFTQYLNERIFFFSTGFIVLMSIITIATAGKTPGRRVMRLELLSKNKDGKETPIKLVYVFLHDIIFKYFLIVILLIFNLMPFAALLLVITIVIDTGILAFSKNRLLIRDYLTKIQIINK